jgi:predicted RNA-binding protein with PUA-like domain
VPYADPRAGDPKLVVVDLRPLRQLLRPVTLAAVKADPLFADFALVREGRLSVVPANRVTRCPFTGSGRAKRPEKE